MVGVVLLKLLEMCPIRLAWFLKTTIASYNNMISVVTPVLNGAQTIERTILSVQTEFCEYEHIIQDGLSSDGTLDIVARLIGSGRIRVFSEADNGIYDAVSRGMAKAKGDILCWLGSDDIYLPWTLSTVEAIFKARPDIQWITGIPAWRLDGGRLVRVSPLAPVFLRGAIAAGWQRTGRLGFLQQESMFWRRSLWEAVGATELIRRYRLAGDYHLWRAFARETRLHTVATVLAAMTLSEEQASNRLARDYLLEAGGDGRDTSREPAAWGRFLNRFLAVGLQARVLRPGRDF